MGGIFKAAITTEPARFELKDFEIPEALSSGSFLSDVKYCAICGSDNQFWASARFQKIALGHELCARITDPGDTSFSVGDRVCMFPGSYCGECESCRQGNVNICTKMFAGGYTGITMNGGFASKYVGRERYALKVPDNVSSQAAAVIEPLATAFHAIRRSRIKLGDKVLVIGAGPIGLYCADLARLNGAVTVVVSEYNKARLATAEKLSSADAYYCAQDEQLNEKLKAEYGSPLGDGFDVIIECSSSEAGYATAIKTAKKRGQVLMVGSAAKPTGIVTNDFSPMELDITPCYAYTMYEYKQCMEFVSAGILDPTKYITRIVALEDIQAAFENLFRNLSNDDLKVLIQPN